MTERQLSPMRREERVGGCGLMEEGLETYPMAMFQTLAVGDVGASVGWYLK